MDYIARRASGRERSPGKFANLPARDLTAADFDQKWDGDFLKGGSPDTHARTSCGKNNYTLKNICFTLAFLLVSQTEPLFRNCPDIIICSLCRHFRLSSSP